MKIEFSTNHNGKLFMEHFTDVRLHEPDKFSRGNELEVFLKGESFGIVKVVSVKVFQFDQLSELLSFLNIGKPQQYYAKVLKSYYGDMAPTQLLDHICFHWKHRNLESQAKALMTWWTDIYSDESNFQPKAQTHG